MRFNPIYIKLAMGSLLLFGWINWHLLGPLLKRYGDRACSGFGRSVELKCLLWFKTMAGDCLGWGIVLFKKWVTKPLEVFFLMFLKKIQWSGSLLNKMFTQWSLFGMQLGTHEVKDWHSVVWFQKYVPSWASIVWLAIQNKLHRLDHWIDWCSGESLMVYLMRRW